MLVFMIKLHEMDIFGGDSTYVKVPELDDLMPSCQFFGFVALPSVPEVSQPVLNE